MEIWKQITKLLPGVQPGLQTVQYFHFIQYFYLPMGISHRPVLRFFSQPSEQSQSPWLSNWAWGPQISLVACLYRAISSAIEKKLLKPKEKNIFCAALVALLKIPHDQRLFSFPTSIQKEEFRFIYIFLLNLKWLQ